MTTTRRRSTRTTKSTRRATATSTSRGPLPVPVRLTRVRAALQRIANGYYDRDDVRDRLATAVLAELHKS